MILIQLILIAAIIAVLVAFLSSRNSSQTQAWKKILLFVLAAAAIILVIFPNTLNGVAHFVGVGRGADLLLYALTVAFIFEQLNNYIKNKEEQRRIVILCRKVAIEEALREQAEKND
jgi:hypothetical protein